MVTSTYERKILERDEKPLTNKETKFQGNVTMSIHVIASNIFIYSVMFIILFEILRPTRELFTHMKTRLSCS